MSWFGEQAREAVRSAGGRMTHQRQIVIDLLENVQGELDIEALFSLAHDRDASLSIATVYRTLHILEVAQLVQQRYRSRDHERRYYEPVSNEHAYHFTCRACHKVIPFRSSLIRELEGELAAELGVTVFSACVCVDGLCPDCRSHAQQSASAFIPLMIHEEK